MALFVIDFDRTIVKGHTHNVISGAIVARTIHKTDQEAQWALVSGFDAIGGADRWRMIFRSLLEKGHDVSIASFNSYPYIIPRFLREVIGLSDDEISRIHVNSWLPADPSKANKNDHIEQIIGHFYRGLGERPARDQVVLIDDSDNNILAAEIAEFRTVHAKPDLQFLDQLLALCSELGIEQHRSSTSTFKR